MKKKTFLLPLLLFITSCDNSKEKHTHPSGSVTVSSIGDVTDKHTLGPIADPLLQLYRCTENPDIECLFRMRSISDKMMTPVTYCRLPSGIVTQKNNKEDDPQFRKRNIIAFYARVQGIVSEFNAPEDSSKALNNSECIRTISDELTYLASSPGISKYLVVFSDLNEKSDLYDVYTNGGTAKGMEDVIKGNDLLPERLENITVIFVFAPKDRKEDQQYREIVAVFKKIIEKKGGQVIIQASNTSYNL